MDTHVKIALQCALSAHIMLCVDCPSLSCLLPQFVVRVIAVLALIVLVPTIVPAAVLADCAKNKS
jgi:hypothetical protein